nr:reverse transcriptase domain-containing protein [Tanacetum cinerariifolium]
MPNFEPIVAPIIEPVVAPVSAPKPNQKPSIPYSSRLHDQKLCDKANDQKENFFQIFQDLNFNISFADALILMPKFGPTIKTLLTNKDKLSEPARTSLIIDFDADPRVPLILGRSFLKTERALIDVKGELTLRVGKEAITFNLDQTSRYSANYNDRTANRIDVIDMACEEYSQEVLGFSNVIASLEDDPTSPKVDQFYFDTEWDILLLEASLNDGPSLPPPTQGNYLPQFRKELKIYLSVKEKAALIKVLKPHKQAIAWKHSDIKGIDPEFYTHKILIEDDFKPAVQCQRRVNPKIYDVIKKEVLKLLDVGLIYPISDSPCVSPVHCVSKKGGFTVVENDENELIPTRLVMVWRVCIDYQKLNEATRKDHFPLPFMDQMLERLAGNKYYCFLDGFLGYFQISIDLKDQEKTTFTHKISKNGIEVDKAKVDVIAKLPHPTTVKVDGVVQIIASTTAEQRLAKKNELKAKETLLMALPDKHQLKFNIHNDAKTLMEAIEKRFRVEVKGSSTSSQNTQNIAFVSSNNTDGTNESVSVVLSVSAASSKATVSTVPNVDSLSDAVIYSFFAKEAIFSRECRSPRDNRNKDTPRRTIPVEVSTSNALVSQCSSSSSGSDNEVASCSKSCSKAYATLQKHYDNSTVEFRKSQFDVLLYKTGLESVEARLVVYQKNETVFEDDIKLLKHDVMLRDNALAELRKKFEKSKKERDELKLTLDKFQTSSKNLKLHSHESDNSVPTSPKNDRYKTGEGYHDVPPPYTRVFLPPKPDLVFNDVPNDNCDYYEKQMAQKPVWNSAMRVNHQNSVRMTHPHSNRNVVPTTVLTRSRLVSLNAARPVPTDVSQSTATDTIKKVNDVVQLHALIDGKKVVVLEDVIRIDLHLDDADGVECLPNEEILQSLHEWRTAWNMFSCSMASVVIILATDNQVEDLTSHSTRYTSPALTHKVFANMRRVGKGFSGVENPLFASILEQPTATSKSSMSLLNTLMETYASLSQKVAELKQDKHTQALGIIKLKKRGRIDQEEVNAASKGVSVAEPTVFNDEEVIMTMAQTLIKLKAEKAKLLDEQIAQKLHDDEVEKLQPGISKKMIIWRELKCYKNSMMTKKKRLIGMLLQNKFKKGILTISRSIIISKGNLGFTYDKVRPIFEREYKKVQTLFKPDKDVEEPKKKRVAEETLLQESFKKLKAVEVLGSESTQETPSNDLKEMSEEDVQNMLEIVQCLNLKLKLYREDLVALWNLVKEKFSLAVPSVDKEKALWVELKRLFEPDANDVLWELQRYMHYPITWKLYTDRRVHQVSSTTRRHDMFMLIENDYPFSNGVMTMMLSAKLQVKEDNEMSRDLVMKIFMEANKPKSRSLDTSSK